MSVATEAAGRADLRDALPGADRRTPLAHVVVLAAGEATRLLPLTATTPKALLSVGGRPAIFHTVPPLITAGARRLTIVANRRERPYLERVVSATLAGSGVELHFVEQPDARGPGEALELAVDGLAGDVLVILADTLGSVPIDGGTDWVGAAPVATGDQGRYCMVVSGRDGVVDRFVDKPARPIDGAAVVGFYRFSDASALREALAATRHCRHCVTGERELSSALEAYHRLRPLRTRAIADWQDIGTLRQYAHAVCSSLPGRCFTELRPVATGWIEKHAPTMPGIIADEMAWFDNVGPEALRVVPRRGAFDDRGYELELLDYPTLAELFLFGALPPAVWSEIAEDLVATMHETVWRPGERDRSEADARARRVYVDKTLTRLAGWDRPDLLNADQHMVNRTHLMGFWEAWSRAQPAIERLVATAADHWSFIHGDLSFANILFSPRARVFRLLDPRGNFGGRAATGDRRYDLAKLRQCYHGGYDTIVSNLFRLDVEPRGGVRLSPFPRPPLPETALDRVFIPDGVRVGDVALIEALLFLSMVPLHAESPERQEAFFYRGLAALAGDHE